MESALLKNLRPLTSFIISLSLFNSNIYANNLEQPSLFPDLQENYKLRGTDPIHMSPLVKTEIGLISGTCFVLTGFLLYKYCFGKKPQERISYIIDDEDVWTTDFSDHSSESDEEFSDEELGMIGHSREH